MIARAVLPLACAVILSACAALDRERAGPLRVVSDTTATGFVFPESVGCDPAGKVLYVSQFGGKELKPAEKDGLGYISKVGLDGRVIEQRAFAETLNKPKGIWIAGGRLWVTDIDSVWIFDLQSKKGRKLELPGIQFANDPAVADGVLYVSDNRSDQLFRVEPADFLDARVQPKVTAAWSKKEINPNGLYPARDGSLLVTDWNSGSFFQWSAAGGRNELAKGFKGPADFCVMGDTAYVPDLPGSVLRIIKLTR